MNTKLWKIGLVLVAVFFCCTVVSCSKDDDYVVLPLSQNGTINGHGYVDLGGSVLWATCNVGANSPEEYGDYYAWGEIEPKSEYTEENCTTDGKEIYQISGDPDYDVARAKWGSPWRMPTGAELCQLINALPEYQNAASEEWATHKGIDGMLITSKINGNSIFLPAAGFYDESGNRAKNGNGYYWSSSVGSINGVSHNYNATYFEFGRYAAMTYYLAYRYYGFSVRPVCDK